MVLDHKQVDFRFLDYDLAVGNQNAEVRDGSLWPFLKPVGDQLFVLGIDGIELSVFCRSAGADETILPALVAHAHQHLADSRFLVGVQKTSRYLHREDADFRVDRKKQRVFQLPFHVDPGESPGHVAVLIDCDLFHAQNIRRMVHVRHLKFSFFSDLVGYDRAENGAALPPALPKTMKFPAWPRGARPLAVRLSCLTAGDGSSNTNLSHQLINP